MKALKRELHCTRASLHKVTCGCEKCLLDETVHRFGNRSLVDISRSSICIPQTQWRENRETRKNKGTAWLCALHFSAFTFRDLRCGIHPIPPFANIGPMAIAMDGLLLTSRPPAIARRLSLWNLRSPRNTIEEIYITNTYYYCAKRCRIT